MQRLSHEIAPLIHQHDKQMFRPCLVTQLCGPGRRRSKSLPSQQIESDAASIAARLAEVYKRAKGLGVADQFTDGETDRTLYLRDSDQQMCCRQQSRRSRELYAALDYDSPSIIKLLPRHAAILPLAQLVRHKQGRPPTPPHAAAPSGDVDGGPNVTYGR